MKGNEEASAKAFEVLLSKLGLGCTWKPVYPENGFPDFEFTVTHDDVSERWAVECTDLHEYIASGDKEESRVGVDTVTERLCERIKAKAIPGFNRRYIITALGPRFGVPQSLIEQRAIAYIASGRTELEALDIPEIAETDTEVRKVKEQVAKDQAKVHITTSLSEVPITYAYGLSAGTLNADGKTLNDDIAATLRYALKRILDDKLPKLVQCKSFDRRMLLVWLGYWVAEPAQVKDALNELDWERSTIDTILLIVPDGNVHWVADPGEVFN